MPSPFFFEKIRYAIVSDNPLGGCTYIQTKQLAESMGFTQQEIVTSFSGAKFLVDLCSATLVCTCGCYQVNNIPCGHAVACIVNLQKEPRN